MIRLMLLGKGSVTAFARKVIVHMHASLHKIVATRGEFIVGAFTPRHDHVVLIVFL